jgi:acetyl esterase/lipase
VEDLLVPRSAEALRSADHVFVLAGEISVAPAFVRKLISPGAAVTPLVLRENEDHLEEIGDRISGELASARMVVLACPGDPALCPPVSRLVSLLSRQGVSSDVVPGVLDGLAPPGSTPSTILRDGVYRSLETVELRYTAFSAEAEGPKPALLLFHGGGWEVGSRHQFSAQAQALSTLGMAVFSFDYRIKSEHGTTPFESVEDAQFAYRWVVENAAEFGVDRERITVGGGSAGAHIALGISLFEARPTLPEPPHGPRGSVLFNPVTDTSKAGFGADRIPGDPARLDVNKHVRPGLPPAIVLHGSEDQLVPVDNSYKFARLMEEHGNVCRLRVYPGAPHAFFNYGFNGTCRHYYETLEAAVDFLVEIEVLGTGASTRVRAINRQDQLENLADAARSGSAVAANIEDLNESVKHLQATLERAIRNDEGANELDTNKILNNVRALIPRLNRLNMLYEYAKK